MITDKNKGITSIRYNHLNLPIKILLKGANINMDNEITYIYNATGEKLEKYVWDKSIYEANKYTKTYYMDSYQYSKETTAHYWSIWHGKNYYARPLICLTVDSGIAICAHKQSQLKI